MEELKLGVGDTVNFKQVKKNEIDAKSHKLSYG
jgi:hypothetical protein